MYILHVFFVCINKNTLLGCFRVITVAARHGLAVAVPFLLPTVARELEPLLERVTQHLRERLKPLQKQV